MKVNELKSSAIYIALKKDKKAQQSALRLNKTKDWANLKLFVAELKQTLLEAVLEEDNIDNIKRYKYLIRGMESIVLLPQLVNDIKKLNKKDTESKRQEKEDAKRRKYNPGAFVNRMFPKKN